MKPPPETFTKNGFDFKQIKRDGDLAIFEKKKPNHAEGHFEVVRIQKHAGYEIGGVKIEPGEVMPSSETWGLKGWTFMDLKSAKETFELLKLTR